MHGILRAYFTNNYLVGCLKDFFLTSWFWDCILKQVQTCAATHVIQDISKFTLNLISRALVKPLCYVFCLFVWVCIFCMGFWEHILQIIIWSAALKIFFYFLVLGLYFKTSTTCAATHVIKDISKFTLNLISRALVKPLCYVFCLFVWVCIFCMEFWEYILQIIIWSAAWKIFFYFLVLGLYFKTSTDMCGYPCYKGHI